MTNVTIRIDEKLKRDAKKALEKQGLDMSTAIKMFFKQVVLEKGLPFLPTHNEKILQQRWDIQAQQSLREVPFSSGQEALKDMI